MLEIRYLALAGFHFTQRSGQVHIQHAGLALRLLSTLSQRLYFIADLSAHAMLRGRPEAVDRIAHHFAQIGGYRQILAQCIHRQQSLAAPLLQSFRDFRQLLSVSLQTHRYRRDSAPFVFQASCNL